MSVDIVIEAQTRSDLGKGASRRLRREDRLPAVIYGGGSEAVSLVLDHSKIIHALENEAFYSSILTVKIDGKAQSAVLRDVQRHAYKPKVLHMDFQRVSDTDKIHMNVPLHFIGEDVAPGVKAGGLITHNMTELEVICAAKDLPEFIEVDVSALEMDGVIHITDIKLPKGVESVELSHGEDHDQAVVVIHKSRGATSDDAAEGEEGAEGEGGAEA